MAPVAQLVTVPKIPSPLAALQTEDKIRIVAIISPTYSGDMETLELLGLALGFATLAGLNLYLTTLVAALAIRFPNVDSSATFISNNVK